MTFKIKIDGDIFEYNLDLEVISVNGNKNLNEKELFNYRNKLFDELLKKLDDGEIEEGLIYDKLFINVLKYIHNSFPEKLINDLKECGWKPDEPIHPFLKLKGNDIKIINKNTIKIDNEEFKFKYDLNNNYLYIYPDYYSTFEINLNNKIIILYRPAILPENQEVEIEFNNLFNKIINKIINNELFKGDIK